MERKAMTVCPINVHLPRTRRARRRRDLTRVRASTVIILFQYNY